MAWLESHGNLARHPKTRRLMRRMGWTLPATIGNLHLLWYWALEYAPTGDLTKFEPEQLTCDLDLGDATPGQFLEAMVEAGFMDLSEGGSRRLHDWPDYTAKSLRPKFRRHPERWHQVLRSYGLPIFTRRATRRVAGMNTPEQHAPPCAVREPKLVEYESPGAARIDCVEDKAREGGGSGSDRSQLALRADPNFIHPGPAPQTVHPPNPEPPSEATDNDVGLTTEQQIANVRRLKGEVPRSLSLIPGFVEVWWPRLLDMYQRKGTPLDSNQRRELLALLCVRPNSSIKLLKLCVEHSLNCRWEHLDNTA